MKTRGKNKSTLILEAAILDIVHERHPITVRGVAYALFVGGFIDSMHRKNTNKVSRVMTRMREDMTLNWRHVVDDSRRVQQSASWADPDELIDCMVDQYRRDYWQDQPNVVEVWAEKATVQGVLGPVLHEFGLPFRVMKGFGSFTAIKQASVKARRAGKPFKVLYAGDWDPSGMFMSQVDIPKRFYGYGGRGDIERIAITEDDHDCASFDAREKTSDTRYDWFVSKYGYDCWELDAMNPNDLRERVREQIEACLDLDAWERAIEVEAAEVESMQEFHNQWQDMMAGGAA